MHQHKHRIVIFFIFFTLHLFSVRTTAADIKTIYSSFLVDQKKFYETSFNKKDFKKTLDNYLISIKKNLSQITNIEKKQKNPTFTKEGNTISVEIENLSSLVELSESKFSKEDCESATISNGINNNQDTYNLNKIQKIIDQLCK